MEQDTGAKITNLVTELRALCMQISLMLKSADSYFEKDGWKTATGNNVTGSNSTSLDAPNYWFPEFFCRFYHSKVDNALMYIAVLLDNRENNGSYKFKEPILTTGYFWKYDNIKIFDYWRCRWHVYSGDCEFKGDIFKIDPKEKEWKEKECNFEFLKSLAVPLASITSSEILFKKAINPILLEFQKENSNT